jgi:hypothetical protein
MGRHDLTLGSALKGRAGLACGIYASTPVETATGWVAMEDLAPGDLVVTRDAGLCPIVTVAPETRDALWAVRFPEGALGNLEEVLLPPGQPVLIETPYATPFTGETQVLVPASSLEGWRGIAPQVPFCPEPILLMRLSQPGAVAVGQGLRLGIEGVETGEADLIRLLFGPPERVVLPLAAARHLVAAMIAEEAGQGLRVCDQAAVLRPENRP